MITQEQLDHIVKRILKLYQPEKIILFGSYANGTALENSDLDLFLVKDTKESPVDRSAALRIGLRDFLLPMDILIYTPEEFEKDKDRKYTFVHEVFKSGKVLYARK
jgi:predicted nucleotidyltransferase